jgi:hypothetical protein
MEILGEILIAVVQLFAEALAELGLEAIREAIRPSKPGRPFVAAIGYVLLASGRSSSTMPDR